MVCFRFDALIDNSFNVEYQLWFTVALANILLLSIGCHPFYDCLKFLAPSFIQNVLFISSVDHDKFQVHYVLLTLILSCHHSESFEMILQSNLFSLFFYLLFKLVFFASGNLAASSCLWYLFRSPSQIS